MELNRNIYSWLMLATAVTAVGAVLLVLFLDDGSIGTRIGLALIPVAVIILFSFLMNTVGRLGSNRKYTIFKKIPDRPADPTGLVWIVAGAWSLLFAIMWVAIILTAYTDVSIWLANVLIILPIIGMGAVDIAVNIRLYRTNRRPINGMILLYTLVDLIDIAVSFFV